MKADKNGSMSRVQRLAVAALLHDIGKLGEPGKGPLPDNILALEQDFCPTDSKSGLPSHRHVLYTAKMLDLLDKEWAREIFRLACSHHRPTGNELDEHILQKADCLSAGSDRIKQQEDCDTLEKVSGASPVLSEIAWPADADLSSEDIGDFQIPLLPSDNSPDTYLPQKKRTFREYCASCTQIEREMTKQLNDLPYTPSHEFINLIQGICRKFLVGIPSSRMINEKATTSLFDHCRSTAAIAACIGAQLPESSGPEAVSRASFRFVDVSIGKIQNFIFRHQPSIDPVPGQSGEKGMAKQLRARSFFVSLVSFVCGLKILDAAGIPITNMLFDAGGHCRLLIPSTPQVINSVNCAVSDIKDWFVRNMAGGLTVKASMSKELSEKDLAAGEFMATLAELVREGDLAAYDLPCSQVASQQNWCDEGWVLGVIGSGLIIDSDDFSRKMVNLGNLLVKREYLCFSPVRGGADSIDVLGYSVMLTDKIPNCAGLKFSLRPTSTDYCPIFPAANYVPFADEDTVTLYDTSANDDEEVADKPVVGELLSFEHIALRSTDDDGKRIKHAMLGILKADVDRLGGVMQFGLSKQLASIGRLASVSRELDDFFKNFLRAFLAEKYPFTYTVFAGGDDLFLVGPWYDIARLARDLHYSFKRLTCSNPRLTFSAGLVFTKPSTPVRHFAESAETALEAAKHGGRNRISFADQTLSWDKFLKAWELHQTMMRAMVPDARGKVILSSSLVYRLLLSAKTGIKPEKLEDYKWRAQLNYDLGRNLPDYKSLSDEGRKLTEDLHNQLCKIQQPDDAKALYVASILTLYRTR